MKNSSIHFLGILKNPSYVKKKLKWENLEKFVVEIGFFNKTLP